MPGNTQWISEQRMLKRKTVKLINIFLTVQITFNDWKMPRMPNLTSLCKLFLKMSSLIWPIWNYLVTLKWKIWTSTILDDEYALWFPSSEQWSNSWPPVVLRDKGSFDDQDSSKYVTCSAVGPTWRGQKLRHASGMARRKNSFANWMIIFSAFMFSAGTHPQEPESPATQSLALALSPVLIWSFG